MPIRTNKKSRSIYIDNDIWEEIRELRQQLTPPKSFSVYLSEALAEKNKKTKKILQRG